MPIFTFNFFLNVSHTSYQWFRVRLAFTFEPLFNLLFDDFAALVVDNFDFETKVFLLGIDLVASDDDLTTTF